MLLYYMPHFSYQDLIKLQGHIQYVEQHNALPPAIAISDLLHVLILHPNPSHVRALVEKDAILMQTLMHSYEVRELLFYGDDSDDPHVQQLNTWIQEYVQQSIPSFFTEECPLSIGEITSLKETPWFPQYILPTVKNLDLKHISLPHGLRNLVLLAGDDHRMAQNITKMVMSYSQEQRNAFYLSFNNHYGLRHLNFSLLKEDKKYYRHQKYTIESYAQHIDILEVFNLQETVHFEPYTKSFASFYKTIKPYTDRFFYRWNFLLTALKPAISIDWISQKINTIDAFFREAALSYYFKEQFPIQSTEEQIKAIHLFWKIGASYQNKAAITASIHNAIMHNIALQTQLSPAFQQIADHQPIDLKSIPKTLEPVLKIWIKQHYPDLHNSLKILGIASTRQLFLHYNKSVAHDYLEETPLHLS